MPTGIYVRSPELVEAIRIRAKQRIGIRRVKYKVNKKGCWIWQNAQDGRGYGHIRANGKTMKAYTFFFMKKYGPIPKGKELDHVCRVKLCVNPDHLEPVTHQINMQRALGIHRNRILKIRSLAKSGLSGAEISRKIKIPERTVYGIISKDRWANIP